MEIGQARAEVGVGGRAGRWSRVGRWVGLVLLLRVVLGALGMVLGLAAPQTAAERASAVVLSPGAGDWLLRRLALPWQRWDVNFYLAIMDQGYALNDGTAAFHPLYPWLGEALAWLAGGPALVGLLLVSTLAAIGYLVVFEALALLDLPAPQARRATLLAALLPPAFVLLAPYPEGLFLLLATLSLLWARRGRWWLAGGAGFLAALTRQQGIVLALPMLWEMAGAVSWRGVLRRPAWWLALALPPLGLVAFVIFRGLLLGDVSFDWRRPDALIYSLLVSRSAREVVPGQRFMLPPLALWLGLRKLLVAPNLPIVIDMALAAGFGAVVVGAWRHMRPSGRAYVVAIALLSFAFHTGPHFPYMGLPRHLLLAVPAFVPLGRLAGWRLHVLVLGCVLGYLLLAVLYFMLAWTP